MPVFLPHWLPGRTWLDSACESGTATLKGLLDTTPWKQRSTLESPSVAWTWCRCRCRLPVCPLRPYDRSTTHRLRSVTGVQRSGCTQPADRLLSRPWLILVASIHPPRPPYTHTHTLPTFITPSICFHMTCLPVTELADADDCRAKLSQSAGSWAVAAARIHPVLWLKTTITKKRKN